MLHKLLCASPSPPLLLRLCLPWPYVVLESVIIVFFSAFFVFFLFLLLSCWTYSLQIIIFTHICAQFFLFPFYFWHSWPMNRAPCNKLGVAAVPLPLPKSSVHSPVLLSRSPLPLARCLFCLSFTRLTPCVGPGLTLAMGVRRVCGMRHVAGPTFIMAA